MSNQLKVSDNMTSFPEVAIPSLTVEEAAEMMSKFKIRHLPIVSQKKLVGIVSHRDLLPYLKEGSRPIGEIMETNIYTVNRGQYLYEVTEEMADKRIGCAVVRSDDDAIVGIFTTTDALYLLSRLLKGADYSDLKVDEINWSQFPDYMI